MSISALAKRPQFSLLRRSDVVGGPQDTSSMSDFRDARLPSVISGGSSTDWWELHTVYCSNIYYCSVTTLWSPSSPGTVYVMIPHKAKPDGVF